MTRRLAFTQADVSRALKGAIVAGLDVRHVEIDREGKIIIRFAADGSDQRHRDGENEWDELLDRK